MENALTDFYTNPDEIHALFDRLTDFYCRILERAVAEVGVDGVFLSDDIGTQNGGFFRLRFLRPFSSHTIIVSFKRLIHSVYMYGFTAAATFIFICLI